MYRCPRCGYKLTEGGPWSPKRQSFLQSLADNGPARPEDNRLGSDCKALGWVDWIRDDEGKVIYGDQRYVITPAGRAILERWRREGR